MNKSIQIISFLLFIAITNVNAQKFELGKVSIEELNEKSHPKDTSAVAAVLFDKGEVQLEYSQTDGFTVRTTVKKRIKIYKKEGYDWANKSVEYYMGGNGLNETVSFSDVISYNLVAGKIEKTKIKSDGIFDEKINRYWARKKITMPNVKVGSIIEFEYTIKSPRISELKEWAFQTSIPVNYSEFKTYIPEYFIYNPNQKGFIFPKVTVEKNNKTINISTKERSNSSLFYRKAGGTTFSYDNIDYSETKTTYLAENLPAMKEESYVNNIDNYTSSISHELSMTKYPNSVPKAYSTSWESVVKTIYDYDDFGPELNKTGYFEEDIKTLIANLNTQDEKIAAIFQYVKSRVKWDNYLGYSCNDGVKSAYKNKTGNVAEINLMLTAMLRYAGIEANPILVSTRSNGISFFPSRTAFNYVIAGVEVSNNLILLDATDKFSVPNVLPLRDLNWFGRLIRKDGTSSEVDLMPKTVSRESSNLSYSLNSDGTVSGKIKNQFSNNNALDFRTKNSGTVQETYLENLENKNNNMEITEYVRENENDLSNPVSETYSFKDTKSVEILNDKIYFSPLMFLTNSENPFKQEKREYPVDFGFPNERRFNINIEIPEGYQVETLPKSENLTTVDNFGTFKYNISNLGKKIQVSIITDINFAIIPAEYYEDLKVFFQKVIEKQTEKIVLKKA